MGTLNEDLSAIKAVEDTIIANKVAKFAYTDEAYNKNDANGVTEYNVNKAQNIPTADPSVLKVNNTVLSKGYRAQASSITRMLMNHFLGRLSYNVNKVNDGFSNLVATLIKHRGTANGFATLDENGRVPYSQLPESAIEYKGQWNAETNTPTLVNGTGTKGDLYVVSVAGTHNFGSGDIQFFVNDRVIYDGSVWTRLPAGDVKTVNNISPTNGNIPLTGENIPVSSTDPTLLSAPLTTDRYANNSVTTEKLADNAVTNAKIKDPISVAKGGTGATDAKNGFMILANGLTQSQDPLDKEYMICKGVSGNWGLYTLLTFWEYIKSKISSALGLTATQYNGNATTATNAYNAYRGMIHTCSTATETASKTVSITGFTLVKGACIRVLFTNGNSVASPTLNVNNTGAKEIRVLTDGSILPLTSKFGTPNIGAYYWSNHNTNFELYYDGTYWLIINNPIVSIKKVRSIGESSLNPAYHYYLNGYKEIRGAYRQGDVSDGRDINITVNLPLDLATPANCHVSLTARQDQEYLNSGEEMSYYLGTNFLKIHFYNRNVSATMKEVWFDYMIFGY